MQRLKLIYSTSIVPLLLKHFEYSNVNEVPKIKKIIVNRGFDESCQATKILDLLLSEFTLITGQKSCIRCSKKAIANFKVREKMPVGMVVTLRDQRMYAFFDRLINLALPRIRDFQGLSLKGFDGSGNYSLGLSEQLMFPEIEFDKISKIQGMNVTIVTTAKTNEEALFLLKELGMPFKF